MWCIESDETNVWFRGYLRWNRLQNGFIVYVARGGGRARIQVQIVRHFNFLHFDFIRPGLSKSIVFEDNVR